MIIDHSSSIPIEMKTRICQVVLENRISSIDMLSKLVGTGEKETLVILQELLEEGILRGSLSNDGTRFFLSDVKVSDAPIVGPADTGPVIVEKDTRVAKTIFIVGFVAIASGYIIRGLYGMNELIQNVGFAILMVGIAILVTGWMMFSRANPPENVQP